MKSLGPTVGWKVVSSGQGVLMSHSFILSHLDRLHISCVCMCVLNRVRLFTTPWTVACQAPLSIGFSRQEYWGGLPFPSPGDLPNPGIKPSPALQADSLLSEPPGEPNHRIINMRFTIFKHAVQCCCAYIITTHPQNFCPLSH